MVETDFKQLFGAILLIVGAVLPVVNPPGDAPLFLLMTSGADDETRATLARKIAVYSFVLLAGSMLIGSIVLRLFGLSIPVVQVAGGAVVCSLGWRLLNDNSSSAQAPIDPNAASAAALARAFYPLTLPLTVDPGVMSVAVTVGANHAHTLDRMLVQVLAALIGAAIIAATVWLSYRYAHRLLTRIGQTGMTVVLRLSAFIVVAIGMQIEWNGIRALLHEVGIPG
jgi:multiple antibiotic resistance protein